MKPGRSGETRSISIVRSCCLKSQLSSVELRRHDAALPVDTPLLADRMTDDQHYRRLENLYAIAPVSRWYGAVAEISDGRARIRIPIRSDFYHPAGAVHGSVYF